MATIQIMLRDTESGLVDVETTVMGGATNTSAVQLAGRIADFLDKIADMHSETVSRDECLHTNTVSIDPVESGGSPLRCTDCGEALTRPPWRVAA